MSACHPSLLSSGNATTAWIATHLREPWLSPLMSTISELGSLNVIIVIMSLAYWCWNKRASRTIWYGIFLSLLANVAIKGWVMECRPPKMFRLEHVSELSYSFPSGHAQVMILMWCGLAYYVRSKWLAALFVLTGLLIAFSRTYLGVHYAHDVVAGLLLGLFILWLCILNEKKDLLTLKRFPLWGQSLIILSFLSLCIFVINNHTGHLAIATAGLFGFWLGSQWEEKYVKFVASFHWQHVLKTSIVGFGGILLIKLGANTLSETIPNYSYVIAYLQYALLGLWTSYLSMLIRLPTLPVFIRKKQCES